MHPIVSNDRSSFVKESTTVTTLHNMQSKFTVEFTCYTSFLFTNKLTVHFAT